MNSKEIAKALGADPKRTVKLPEHLQKDPIALWSLTPNHFIPVPTKKVYNEKKTPRRK